MDHPKWLTAHRSKRSRKLIEQLPFDGSRFVKLSVIGRDNRLQRTEARALLPPHHNTLFELTKRSDNELELAMAAQVVDTEMSRAHSSACRHPGL